MAHIERRPPSYWPSAPEHSWISERVPDSEWESNHMPLMFFDDPIGIGTCCQECAEALYDQLADCARRHGLERLP